MRRQSASRNVPNFTRTSVARLQANEQNRRKRAGKYCSKITRLCREDRDMYAKAINPILNVSDMQASYAWFEKLGWTKLWEWGDPTGFAAVGSGECEIFLCHGGQGGRGKSASSSTFGADGAQTGDKGVWMSIWVDDVDTIHRRCLEHGIEVPWPPTNMEWNVREMHIRHPDGHVFRITKGLHET